MTKSDKILLKHMSFVGNHGLFSEEKTLGQEFIIDLELSVDLHKVGETDYMLDSVHYGEVFEAVQEIVEGEPVNLIEKLATDIAKKVLNNFELVNTVDVTVKKPSAPIRGHFDYVAVQINRSREDFE